MQHLELFKELVKAYYFGDFEATVSKIVHRPEFTEQEAMHIISALCGVKVDSSEDLATRIKEAIKSNQLRTHIVEKLVDCTTACETGDGGESPCQLVCPISAIIEDPVTHLRHIDKDLCLDCGKCVAACENKKILDRVEFFPTMELIKNKKRVIAEVAPAITGQWGPDVSLEQLRTAFIKMGFADMVEVALAADVLTIKEAIEFNHHVHHPDDLMITSCCCPVWVGLLRKVYHDLVKDVSPSVSPMIAMGRILKLLDPSCHVIFIGPCIAKKREAHEADLEGTIDYVLTFEEVKGIFDVLDIDPGQLEPTTSELLASKSGRLYARTGGVSIAVSDVVKDLFPDLHTHFEAVQANGAKECKAILNDAMEKNISANFIEGMACIGGCVGGPKALIPKDQGTAAANEEADRAPSQVATHNEDLKALLAQLDIKTHEDYLNLDKVSFLERDIKTF